MKKIEFASGLALGALIFTALKYYPQNKLALNAAFAWALFSWGCMVCAAVVSFEFSANNESSFLGLGLIKRRPGWTGRVVRFFGAAWLGAVVSRLLLSPLY